MSDPPSRLDRFVLHHECLTCIVRRSQIAALPTSRTALVALPPPVAISIASINHARPMVSCSDTSGLATGGGRRLVSRRPMVIPDATLPRRRQMSVWNTAPFRFPSLGSHANRCGNHEHDQDPAPAHRQHLRSVAGQETDQRCRRDTMDDRPPLRTKFPEARAQVSPKGCSTAAVGVRCVSSASIVIADVASLWMRPGSRGRTRRAPSPRRSRLATVKAD